jgi:hypothetical protein
VWQWVWLKAAGDKEVPVEMMTSLCAATPRSSFNQLLRTCAWTYITQDIYLIVKVASDEKKSNLGQLMEREISKYH